MRVTRRSGYILAFLLGGLAPLAGNAQDIAQSIYRGGDILTIARDAPAMSTRASGRTAIFVVTRSRPIPRVDQRRHDLDGQTS